MIEGRVSGFDAEEGWGTITSPHVDGQVWVHYSAIDAEGYRALEAGEAVEFEFRRVDQDGFRYAATLVRRRQGRGAPGPA